MPSQVHTTFLDSDPQNWQRLSKFLILGHGSPLNVVVAKVGALYLRLDGGAATTLYVKESGIDATGWVAK